MAYQFRLKRSENKVTLRHVTNEFKLQHVGRRGLSAYQVAVENGYVGTIDEWLASLNIALPNGGTTGQFLRKASNLDDDVSWQNAVKADVGLGNVDNTSDVNKPISSATQNALDLKADLTYVNSLIVTVGPINAQYITDGTADDIQINQAINALFDAGGGTVRIALDDYSILDSILLKDNVSVEFAEGSTVSLAAGANCHAFANFDSANGNTNIAVKNVAIDGNASNQTGNWAGLRLFSVSNSTFENISISNTGDTGLFIRGASDIDRDSFENKFKNISVDGVVSASANAVYSFFGTRNEFDGLNVHDNAFNGIYIESSDHCILSNSRVVDNEAKGVQFWSASNNTIEHNFIDSNGLYGLGVDNGSHDNLIEENEVTNNHEYGILLGSIIAVNNYSNRAINNIVDYNGDDGLVVYYAPKSYVAGNYVRFNGTAGTDDGIPVDHSPDSIVIGNHSEGNAANGIQLKNGSHRCTIENNIVKNNSNPDVGGSTNAFGIMIEAGITYCDISGNVSYCDNASTSQYYGINVTGAGIDYNVFSNNIVYGNRIGQLRVNTDVGIHNVFRDNPGSTSTIINNTSEIHNTDETSRAAITLNQRVAPDANIAPLIINSTIAATTANAYGLMALRHTNASTTNRLLWMDHAGTGEAATIRTAGGKGTVYDDNGNALAIDVDQDVTNTNSTTGAQRIVSTAVVNDAATYSKSGNALDVTSNVILTSGTITDTSSVATLTQSNTANTGVHTTLVNAGTNTTLLIDPNNNTGTDPGLAAGQLIENTGNTGYGLSVISTRGATQASALASLKTTSTTFSKRLLEISHSGTGEAERIVHAANASSPVTALSVSVSNAGAGGSVAAAFSGGPVTFGAQKISNIDNPTAPQDAATKDYVDNKDTYLTYQSAVQSVGTLEGATSDGTNIYTTTTTVLSKYNYAGTLLATRDIANDDPASTAHKGDLCYKSGFLYVGNGYTAIGQPGSVIKINATTLAFVSIIPTYDGVDAASVAVDAVGHFWVSTYTGISLLQGPRVQEYDASWNYIGVHELEKVDPNGGFGYDGIDWRNGQLWANIHENMQNNEYVDVYDYDGTNFTRVKRVPHYINGLQNGQGISFDPLDSSILWMASRSNGQVVKTLIDSDLDFASIITKGLDITVPVGGNRTVMTLAQKDTTNSPRGLLIRQFADNEALRIESSATTDSVIEAYASGVYSGVGDQTAFNFTLTNANSIGQLARFKHNGPGGNVLMDSNNDGLVLYVDRDVTNANTSTVASKISDVSTITDGGSYTKTGALFQIVNGATVTSGSLIDTAQIIDIDQNNPNATNDIISVSSLSTSARLAFFNSVGAMTGASGRAVVRTDQNSLSSAHAELVNNAGTGIGKFINQTGNGSPLTATKNVTNATNNSGSVISSNSIVTSGANITKSDTALAVSSAVTLTSGTITNTSKVLTVTQSDVNATGNAAEIVNAGTKSSLLIDPNGVTGTDPAIAAGLLVENTGNSGYGFSLISTRGATQASALGSIKTTSTAFSKRALEITHVGTGEGLKIGHAANAAGAISALNITASNAGGGAAYAAIFETGSVGIGTTTPTSKLDVSDDRIRVRTALTPASATAPGNQGDIAWDANYMYVCTANNVWRRTPLSAW